MCLTVGPAHTTCIRTSLRRFHRSVGDLNGQQRTRNPHPKRGRLRNIQRRSGHPRGRRRRGARGSLVERDTTPKLAQSAARRLDPCGRHATWGSDHLLGVEGDRPCVALPRSNMPDAKRRALRVRLRDSPRGWHMQSAPRWRARIFLRAFFRRDRVRRRGSSASGSDAGDLTSDGSVEASTPAAPIGQSPSRFKRSSTAIQRNPTQRNACPRQASTSTWSIPVKPALAVSAPHHRVEGTYRENSDSISTAVFLLNRFLDANPSTFSRPDAMRTRVDTTLQDEARRFSYRFACEDCAHAAALTSVSEAPGMLRCSLGYPAEPRREALSGRYVTLCKTFELR